MLSFSNIVLITLLVQTTDSTAQTKTCYSVQSPQKGIPIALSKSKSSVKTSVSNKDDNFNNKEFNSAKGSGLKESSNENSLLSIRNLLTDLIDQLRELRKRRGEQAEIMKSADTSKKAPLTKKTKRTWGKWSAWASCSVTCGKGRKIRWRQCVSNCDGIETEMDEKLCQLPACGAKLFGMINMP